MFPISLRSDFGLSVIGVPFGVPSGVHALHRVKLNRASGVRLYPVRILSSLRSYQLEKLFIFGRRLTFLLSFLYHPWLKVLPSLFTRGDKEEQEPIKVTKNKTSPAGDTLRRFKQWQGAKPSTQT